jgi:acetyl esterase/lipase
VTTVVPAANRAATAIARATVRQITAPILPIALQRRLAYAMGRPLWGARAAVSQSVIAGVPAEVVTPPVTRGERRIIYLHGGGYVCGSPRGERPITTHLATMAGATVFALAYRLAPEHPLPAGLDGVIAAYRELSADDGATSGIVLAGESAGAGLALAAAIAIRDANLRPPASVLLFSPPTDQTMSGESMTARARRDPLLNVAGVDRWFSLYRGGVPADDPRCSPLFADLRDLPPIFVQVGSEEVLFSDAERLAAACPSAHLDVLDGCFHGFQLLASVVPAAHEALARAARFAEEAWS